MPTTTSVSDFVINKVSSKTVYDAMVAKNLVNENELYLVVDDEDDQNITTVNGSVPANNTATIAFTTNRWGAIIMVRGSGNNLYGQYIACGFGSGGASKYILTQLAQGSVIAASVDGQTIKIVNSGIYVADISVLMLFGDAPTITTAATV